MGSAEEELYGNAAEMRKPQNPRMIALSSSSSSSSKILPWACIV